MQDLQNTSSFDSAPKRPTPKVLEELAPSPWRSLGRIFDYRSWPERERFIELDAVIAKSRLEQEHTGYAEEQDFD